MAGAERSFANSEAAYARARKVLPGGVSSPVRSFLAVGGAPVFIREGQGCRVTDVDGNVYVDYIGSYGPLIVGHAHERVVAALSKAIGRGTSFGACTEMETRLAQTILAALPGADMIRFVNSGTEAAMSALRLARASTGRDLVLKFAGCYHGHVDSLLVEAGSGAATLGAPSSPGLPRGLAETTLVAPFNDLGAVEAALRAHAGRVACVAVEPVAGNMGVIPPADGFLKGLRALCDEHGSLLLFDEVMTGFRVAWGGAQTLAGVRPDLTCLGKIIGGGLPVGAYAGPKAVMELLAPTGPVYQAGTLSGNPLAMSAGLETLEILREEGAYDALEQRGARLEAGLRRSAAKRGVPVVLQRVGSMLSIFFVEGDAVVDYEQARASDAGRFAAFFHAMLRRGVHLPPSRFEAWFVSLAHDEAAIDQTIDAADEAFAAAGGA